MSSFGTSCSFGADAVFFIGETISLGIASGIADDPALIAAAVITANLKQAVGNTVPPASAPSVATFGVAAYPAAPATPTAPAVAAGWTLTLTPEQTAALAPGVYCVNARASLPLLDFVVISDPIFLELRPSTT